MTTEKDLVAEVAALVEAEVDRGNTVKPTWLTQAIIAAHDNIEGEDTDWYRVCGYAHVRQTIRQVLRRYKPDPEEEGVNPQLVLPGFDHLQKAYVVSRDGEQTIVPVDQLTNDEIQSKIDELQTMAAGCLAHARELERYMMERAA